MFTAQKKRLKLSNNKQNDSAAANSLDHGIESDFGSSSVDFTLRRKCPSPRHVSFCNKDKHSFEVADQEQTSLGYGSMQSSSLSISSPHKSLSRTPKKRKLDETDENANSPLKIRKRDPNDPNGAKLILKEKCSSENVILCSTPNQKSKSKLWGKSRSLHAGKIEFRKSIDDKLIILPKCTETSFEIGSSFELTNSFSLSETHDNSNIPSSNYQQLFSGQIKVDSIVRPRPSANASPVETVTQPQDVSHSTSNVSATSSTGRTYYSCGRMKMNILGMLHIRRDPALNDILSYLRVVDILSLSHVSKDYRNMIKSNKIYEPKRQNYLKAHQMVKENKLPGSIDTSLPAKLMTEKARKGKFGDSNINHSMQLRSKTPQSPPVSPSRRKFHENQKVKLEIRSRLQKF